jgi:hypothetical protein
MAHIDKRAEQRYRVRYRDPSGLERSQTFHRLNEARRFKAYVEDEMGRGLWVDPRAGRTPLKDFASLWSEDTTFAHRRATGSPDSCAARSCPPSDPCP